MIIRDNKTISEHCLSDTCEAEGKKDYRYFPKSVIRSYHFVTISDKKATHSLTLIIN